MGWENHLVNNLVSLYHHADKMEDDEGLVFVNIPPDSEFDIHFLAFKIPIKINADIRINFCRLCYKPV